MPVIQLKVTRFICDRCSGKLQTMCPDEDAKDWARLSIIGQAPMPVPAVRDFQDMCLCPECLKSLKLWASEAPHGPPEPEGIVPAALRPGQDDGL